MDCIMRGFPVHHQLPELAQTHVHRVGDAIKPSHPLSSASPPAFNLSHRTSNTMSNKREHIGHLCLVPDFRGKAFSIEHGISCWFLITSLYYIEICPLYTNFEGSFYHKWFFNFVKCFFCVYWDDLVIFILPFVNVVGGHGNLLQYSCLQNPHGKRGVGRLQSMGLQTVGHDWSDLALVNVVYHIDIEPSADIELQELNHPCIPVINFFWLWFDIFYILLNSVG